MYPQQELTRIGASVQAARDAFEAAIAPDGPAGCAVTYQEARQVRQRFDLTQSQIQGYAVFQREVIHAWRTGRHSRDFRRDLRREA